MAATQHVHFNPLRRAPKIKKVDTEKAAAQWFRQLADDIEAKKVVGMVLRMDAFGKIEGSIEVELPPEHLSIGSESY